MTLDKFAKKAGVVIVPCDPKQWGGGIAYKEKSHPSIVVCGFKSKDAAYKHWLENAFGEGPARAVIELLQD